MIENNYEEDVGIHDGDLFLANDPVIAGVHAADLYDILPVFWEGELVAWVCTVIMEMDIGAVSPGCMPTTAVERGADGIKFCCEKIGTNDKMRRDFEIKIEMSLDMADLFLLDRKGAVAANIRVREEIKDMIREFRPGLLQEGHRGSSSRRSGATRSPASSSARSQGATAMSCRSRYTWRSRSLLAARQEGHDTADTGADGHSAGRAPGARLRRRGRVGLASLQSHAQRLCGAGCPYPWCRPSPTTAGPTWDRCSPAT